VSPSVHSLDQLKLHRSVLHGFVDRAESVLNRDDVDSAVGLLSMAADFASRNHTGLFTDGRLERQVLRCARRIDTVGPNGETASQPDVVHVVGTSVTRSVEETVSRWARFGVGQSTVVATGDYGSTLDRAAELRGSTAGASLVVLHTDPHDLVPLLAFGVSPRPPVVIVNHHDNVFWPGVAIADLVVSHRATGSALAVDRRCVPVGRTLLLPPWRADDEIWASVLGVVHERALEVSSAMAPPPALPRPFDDRDIELLRELTTADRADGLLGAVHRRGGAIAESVRPRLSVAVLSSNPDNAVESLHRALDTWMTAGTVQLILIDRAGTDEMNSVLDELTGTVLGIRTHGLDDADAITSGLKWAWAPYVAIIHDDASPMIGSWEVSLQLLEDDPSRAVVPIMGMDEHKPDGVLVRVDGQIPSIEQVFDLVGGDVDAQPVDFDRVSVVTGLRSVPVGDDH